LFRRLRNQAMCSWISARMGVGAVSYFGELWKLFAGLELGRVKEAA
jgi:hypothetical protein